MLEICSDVVSIKYVTITTFDGTKETFGGKGSPSSDWGVTGLNVERIKFDNFQSLIALFGFTTEDKSQIIGLGGILDKCEQ